jgi:hypothetical protein
MRKVSASTAAFLIAAVIGLGSAGVAGAAVRNVCPPGGTSDSTYRGGLIVTGDNYCTLDNVTVVGGLTVAAGSDVDLEGATITGGVHVLPGGEIEVDPGSVFGDNPRMSTILGGIRLDSPVDWDIETARISGGVTIRGGVEANPTFCGNHVVGSMSIRNVSTEGTWVGDPVDEFFECGGNSISGSLQISNSSFFEVEGNRVGGSVVLVGSSLEFNGNHVGGSLFCSAGTSIETGEPGDPSGNDVRGANTC